jgi:transposase-like protein
VLKGYIWNNIYGRGRTLMTVLLDNFVCKICGSKNLVRYGGYKDKQHWFCKDCKHKFTDNDALPEMKTPSGIIVQALSMYYRGMSINDIRDHISQTYGLYPSHSTIYEWIKKYSQIAINEANKYTPKVD